MIYRDVWEAIEVAKQILIATQEVIVQQVKLEREAKPRGKPKLRLVKKRKKKV